MNKFMTFATGNGKYKYLHILLIALVIVGMFGANVIPKEIAYATEEGTPPPEGWTAKFYDTYQDQNNPIHTITGIYGGGITPPAGPVHDGLVFIGWQVMSGGSFDNVTSDMTAFAEFRSADPPADTGQQASGGSNAAAPNSGTIDPNAIEPEPGQEPEPGAENPAVITYYIEGSVYNTKPANADGIFEKIPVYRSDFPDRATRFIGWYTSEGVPFDFTQATEDGATVSVYAEFEWSYLIKYKSGVGGDDYIIDSKLVEAGSVITATSKAGTLLPPAGKDNAHISHWYIEGGDPGVPFEFGFVTATSDLTLIAYWSDSLWVIFESAGTAVDPQIVEFGNTAIPPAAPERIGFDFIGWKEKAADGTLAASSFNFSSAIKDNTTLVAQWEGTQVDYTVVIWNEKPDVPGDPGFETGNYQFDRAFTKTGIAGSVVDYSDNGAPQFLALNDAEKEVKYSQFRHGDKRVLQGNGLTVINLYFERNVYTLNFDLSPGTNNNRNRNGATMVFEGITYTQGTNVSSSGTASNGNTISYPDVRYSFTAKYEQNIESLWPSSANAKFVKETSVRSSTSDAWGSKTTTAFASWGHTGIPATSNFVSKRFTMTADMIPNSGTSVTFTANWASVTNNVVEYWLERLPGEDGSQKITGSTKYYTKSDKHSQDIALSGNLVAKSIEGTTNVKDKDIVTTSNGVTKYQFFYNRNVFPLNFNFMGGAWDGPSLPTAFPDATYTPALDYSRVMFDSKLSFYEPIKIPVRSGYAFEGWFYDAEYFKAVDFEKDRMPNAPLALFAKWQANDFEIKYHEALSASAAQVGDAQPIGDGEFVNFNTAPYQLRSGDISGTVVPGKGEFEGWYIRVGNSWGKWPEDRPVTGNLNLYAGWITDGFTITYSLGEGDGIVPSDGDMYWLNERARLAYDTGIEPPPGKVLIGWTAWYNGISAEEAAIVHEPGDIIRIQGDTIMTAMYAPVDDCIKIFYYPNYPGAENVGEPVSQWVVVRDGAITLRGEIFTFATAYLDGWGREAGRNDFALGGKIPEADISGLLGQDGNIHLYGHWQTEIYKITFTAANNGTLVYEENDVPTIIYDKILGGTLWSTAVSEGVPETKPNTGYYFAGWTIVTAGGTDDVVLPPAGGTTVTGNLTYVAVFKPLLTVTYLPGTYGTFDEQVYRPAYGVPTPEFEGEITGQPGWIFAGWDPEVAETVTGDATYIAKWQPVEDALIVIVANSLINEYNGLVQTAAGYEVEYRVNGVAIDNVGFTAEAVSGTSITSDPSSTDVTPAPIDNVVTLANVIIKYNGEDVTSLVSIEKEDGILNITPVDLTIKVEDQTVAQGTNENTLRFSLTMATFVPGEDYTNLTLEFINDETGEGEIAYETGYTAAALAGQTFPASLVDGKRWTSENYNITYLPGIITVIGGGGTVLDPPGVTTTINGTDTPLASTIIPPEAPPLANIFSWALLNLILTIVVGLIMIALLVTTFFKRRKEDEEKEEHNNENEDEEKEKIKKYIGLRLLSIVATVIAIILFILTQDMRLPMVFVDKWTIWHVIIVAATLILAWFSRKKYEEEDDETLTDEAI